MLSRVKRAFGILFIATFLCSISSLQAQQETTLYIEGASEDARFGADVELYGDSAMVGAPGYDDGYGAIYLYTYSEGEWSKQKEIAGFNSGSARHIGTHIAFDHQSLFTRSQESVYNGKVVFMPKRKGAWDPDFSHMFENTIEDSSYYGTSIDLHGDRLTVGAPYGMNQGGRVFVYDLSESEPDTVLSSAYCPEEFTNCIPKDPEYFGTSLDLHKNSLAVGAPRKDLRDRSLGGGVYLYSESDGTWSRDTLIQPAAEDTTVFFGQSVDMNDEYLVVSDPYNHQYTWTGGMVFVYRKSGDGWVLDQSIVGSDVKNGHQFGSDVAINNQNTLVVGAQEHTTVFDCIAPNCPDWNTGSVYVYERSGNRWTETRKIKASDADTSDLFGANIALNNSNQLIVGVPENKDVAEKAEGAAYIYDLNTITDIEDRQPATPAKISLKQNYPNPFNPSTRIRFSLPEASEVQLTVYNTVGQEIATLANRKMSAGSHSVQFKAGDLSSGVYIYRLKTAGYTDSRKMLLLK